MKRDKISNETIIEAFKAGNGFASQAAISLKVCRATLWKWIKEDIELDLAIKDIEEEKLDLTESKLLKLINDGNPAAIFFHLKCKGKGRGYVERQELSGPHGEPIQTTSVINFLPVSRKEEDDR